MSNHDIFMLPGTTLLSFIASLIGWDASTFSPQVQYILAFTLTLIFWGKLMSVLAAMIKKKLGI